MLTPRFRVFLIALTVATGILLLWTHPYLAVLTFIWGVLFILGYFRAGTVRLAFQAFRQGKLDRAARLLDQVARPDWLDGQNQAYYHWVRGAVELQGGRPEAAVEHLLLAFEGKLRTTNARSGVALTLAQAWIEQGDPDRAETALETARELPHKPVLDGYIDRINGRLRQLRAPDPGKPVHIEGEHVHLRDAFPEDLEALVTWWTTERAWMEWDAPWEQEPMDEASARAHWEERVAAPKELPRCRMMISLPDLTPIGRVNLYWVDDDPEQIALGINVHESPLWGKGLGTEALALWADYVFNAHDRDRLFLETWSGNERMLRVAAKLGFVEVGRRRNSRQVRGKSHDALRLSADHADFRRSVVELGIVLPE